MKTPQQRGWFDSHVHLERYSPSERVGLLERAARAGVRGMLAVSMDCPSSARTVGLSGAVWKAVGVHPLRAAALGCDALAALARAPGVVAIGETGFDAAGPAPELQAAVFRAQCELTRSLDLALVLHIDGDGAWDMLRAEADALSGLRVVRHYFRGDAAQLRWHMERGHFVSFGRSLLREPELQELAARCPAERLLIETDSYPMPGRTTEPCDVVEVGETLARLRGWSVETCKQQLWLNAVHAFALGGRN